MHIVRILPVLGLLGPSLAKSSDNTSSDSREPAASTCRSGPINYITASLPRQCMTTNRSATTGTVTIADDPVPSISCHATTPDVSRPSTTRVESIQSTDSTFPPAPEAVSISLSVAPSSSSTTPIAVTKDPDQSVENDNDSPLDNANFLSFEEWRKRNLAKAGQNPEHVGQQRAAEDIPRRTRPGNSNDFDVLGEDSEIELDFTGFGAAGSSGVAAPDQGRERASQAADQPQSTKPVSQSTHRSKDAGRTCKERTNYASFDCAATVLKTNPECKSSSSLLVENKDSYMLNICKVQNKFFIVELCNDILIDTVVLANYEFFSSIFRNFRLSVSDRYPVKTEKWRELGVYEARNTRDVQAFLVEEPLIWARFLRVEFLSHYGNEYYCPVSLLRVHGTTMMEEFRHQEDMARGEYLEEGTVEGVQQSPDPNLVRQEPAEVSLAADKSATSITSMTPEPSVAAPADPATSTTSRSVQNSSRELPTSAGRAVKLSQSSEIAPLLPFQRSPAALTTAPKATLAEEVRFAEETASSRHNNSHEHKHDVRAAIPSGDSQRSQTTNATGKGLRETADSDGSTSFITESNGLNSIESTAPIVEPPRSTKTGTSSVEAPKRPSPIVLHAPSPSTQESFFKSIHKRLQALESNATLSLQYIEESSRMLRDAFGKVERRQIRKTETFLSSLNATVHAELHAFRSKYDLLWQSTVIELEHQRGHYQAEMRTVTGRLDVLASELLFQKRMVVVQSTLLMLCLVFVLFSRTGSGVEVGLLAQLAKSPMLRGGAKMYSPPLSPDGHHRTDSPGWRSRLWRRSISPGPLSNGGEDDGVTVKVQAATPGDSSDEEPASVLSSSEDEQTSEGDDMDVENEVLGFDERRPSGTGAVRDPVQAPVGDELVRSARGTQRTIDTPLQTQSSPSTPLGTRGVPVMLPGPDGTNGILSGPVTMKCTNDTATGTWLSRDRVSST